MGKILDNIDLTVTQRKQVAKLLKRYLPDTEVWAYGSRVKFTTRPASDLDMVAFAKPEQKIAVVNLREAFEESNLPFEVSLLIWDELPENFHKNIEREYFVLQKGYGKMSGSSSKSFSTPSGWRETKLSSAINLIGGGTPKRSHSEYWSGTIPWLSVKDFNSDYRRIDQAEESITELGLANSSTKILEKDQLIISARGTVGALAQLAKPMAFNQSCYGIDAKPEYATNDFLYYLIRSSVSNLQRITHGAVFDTITRETFDHIWVKLPPLSEQRAIANILGALDDKIELNRQMSETLESMAKALFKSWFIDFDPVIDNALAAGNPIPESLEARATQRKSLGDDRQPLPDNLRNLFPSKFEHTDKMGWIPKGWRISMAGKEFKIVGGGTPSTKDESYWLMGSHAFCTPKDMSQLPTKVLLNTERLLTDEGVQKISSGLLPAGTVLMSSRAPIGYLAVADIPTVINQGIIAIIKQVTYGELFALCWLSSNMNKIMERASGSTFLEINKANFRSIPLLRPNDTAIKAFNDKVKEINTRIISCVKEMRSLSQIRDTLLPKIISGEIRLINPKGS